nr:PREDICTED: uncharacterized protein LOC109030189 [Bemisia tabaci]
MALSHCGEIWCRKFIMLRVLKRALSFYAVALIFTAYFAAGMHAGNQQLNQQPNQQPNQQLNQQPNVPQLNAAGQQAPPPPAANQVAICKFNCMVTHDYHVFYENAWRPVASGYLAWVNGQPICKCILSSYFLDFCGQQDINPRCGEYWVGWPTCFKAWVWSATKNCRQLVKTRGELDHLVTKSLLPVPGTRQTLAEN